MNNRERGEAGFSGWQTGRSPIGKTFAIMPVTTRRALPAGSRWPMPKNTWSMISWMR